MRKEAQAFKRVRTALRSPSNDEEAAKLAFEKVCAAQCLLAPLLMGRSQVFHSDVLNLLSMADMWKTRAPPVPLSFEGIKDGTFILRGKPTDMITSNGMVTPTNSQNGHDASTSAATVGLKDQKTLTLEDNLELFVSRYKLANQQRVKSDADRITAQGVLQPVCKRGKKRFHSTKMMTIRWIL